MILLKGQMSLNYDVSNLLIRTLNDNLTFLPFRLSKILKGLRAPQLVSSISLLPVNPPGYVTSSWVWARKQLSQGRALVTAILCSLLVQ